MNTIKKKYACPMHPEIKGNFNDKCSICGMSLNIPLAKNAQKLNIKNCELNKY